MAHELTKKEGIIFKYLEMDFNNGSPIYTYELLDGISAERMGLQIVLQEGVMDIIEAIIEDTYTYKPKT